MSHPCDDGHCHSSNPKYSYPSWEHGLWLEPPSVDIIIISELLVKHTHPSPGQDVLQLIQLCMEILHVLGLRSLCTLRLASVDGLDCSGLGLQKVAGWPMGIYQAWLLWKMLRRCKFIDMILRAICSILVFLRHKTQESENGLNTAKSQRSQHKQLQPPSRIGDLKRRRW